MLLVSIPNLTKDELMHFNQLLHRLIKYLNQNFIRLNKSVKEAPIMTEKVATFQPLCVKAGEVKIVTSKYCLLHKKEPYNDLHVVSKL